MLSYPWTIAEHGIERTIHSIKHDLHADRLYVAVNYHSGRLFQPLSGRKITMRHEATHSFPPDAACYPAGWTLPTDEGTSYGAPDVQWHIRKACEDAGVEYHAWVVGLHNSSIGRTHPECCMHNAFGDVYDFGLCPANPLAVSYVCGLVQDVCAHLQPASVLMEAHGFLGFVHGHHHEKVMSRLGPVCEYLLSLCFCPSCKMAAQAAEIDVDRLQMRVRHRIETLSEQERGSVSGEFTQAELACLLMEDEELYAYNRMRMDQVSKLVSALKRIVKERNSKLVVMPAYMSSNSWIEGTSLSKLASIVDGFMILTYFADADKIKADIEWLRLFVGETPITVCLNAGAPSTVSGGALQGSVRAALACDPAGIAYYNLSLLTRTRLGWIGEANRMIRS
jgi:hypothetical protein